jgi:PKD repeat protein
MKKTFTRFAFLFAIIFSSISSFGQNYIDFDAYPDGNCEPAQLTFYNYCSISVIQGTPEYKWYIDNTLVSTEVNPSGTFPLLKGIHAVRLDVYDSFDNSLLGTKSYDVYIYGVVTDFLVSTGTSVCPGQEITFSLDPNESYNTATWDFGYNSYFSSRTSSNVPANYTYDKAGTFQVKLITDNFCGTDSVFKTITVSAAAKPVIPAANIMVQAGCVNDPVSFSVIGNFSSYLWEFGDGSTSNLPAPTYTYKTNVARDYTAKLTVTSECGGSGFTNFPVNIQSGIPSDASFTYQNQVGQTNCAGTPLRFEPNGSGSYLWDFGDGTTSNEKNPVHRFTQPYYHYVSLTVTNGCLNKSTITNEIDIPDYDESYVPYPYFSFDSPWYGQIDTLRICPGQTAGFLNQTYAEPGFSFSWDFGDGTSSYSYNASHLYQNPGMYTVVLTISNICGSYQTTSKLVQVDDLTLPVAVLKSFPDVVCPNDKVYFYDENFDSRNNYTYSIIFGDGQSVNNIKNLKDLNIQTLADHGYNTGGPYTYTFFATNFCGNTHSENGLITVDNSSTRKPSYYVDNSTENYSALDPVDWSIRQNPTDYEIDISVNWPAWNASYGNDFYVFLWYGGIDPYMESGMMRNPNGFVKFTSASIVSGATVKAFVPLSQLDDPTIGIAAGYYCGGVANYAEKPEAMGTLQLNTQVPIPSIPIIPSGYTNLASQNMSITIDPFWDGICNSSKIEYRWYRLVSPGVYAILNLWDTGDGMAYDMSYQDAIVYYTKSNYVGGGNYDRISNDANRNNDSINFYSSWSSCYFNGYYKMNRINDNTLQFISYDEPCPDRLPFISGTFTKIVQNPADEYSSCPGDKVQFMVVGGKSYLWNFGDGNTSTAQYPLHAYATANHYNASVTVTNSCGRQDILYTKVSIVAKPASQAYFFVPENEKVAGDSTHFRAEYYDNSDYDNNTYLWNFGDGSSSTLKNPAHIFRQEGNYNVSLTITNGCGSATSKQLIVISPKISPCEAQFDYWSDGGVGFNDLSYGNPTSWSWDFGDGTYSTEQYPPTHYYVKDGAYQVTLTIFNDFTKCVSSVTKDVIAGWVSCQADFDIVINTSSGVTKFFSKSQNAINYYWEFGDGEYSTEAEPVHTFSKNGVYPVCLYIWDNDVESRCQSVKCKDVMFIPDDGYYIEADYSFFTDPASLKVGFSDMSTFNTTEWSWNLGDGSIINTQNPVYTYSKPGVYKVCLTVYDNLNNLSNSICKEVRIGDVPCNLGSDFSYVISPEVLEVVFLSKTQGISDFYFWTFGDGNSSTDENPYQKYSKPGYYEISLSVISSTDGCIDQTIKYVQVGNADCRAGFEYRLNADNKTVNFMDESKGSIEYYYWDFGDGNYSVTQSPDHVYKNSDMYFVGLTVISGECMDYIEQSVQVGEINCAADFKTFIDPSSNTAYFTNRVLGESTALFWSFGDGRFSTDQNPVHEFPTNGLYTAALNTYDLNSGCMDYYQELIQIGGIGIDCNADFMYRVDAATNTVTFKNNSKGDIVESLWNFGDESLYSSDTDPVYTYEKPGNYYVTLSVFKSDGIKNMAGKWILVDANNAYDCHADFMFNIDSASRKVKFVDKSFGDNLEYKWDFDDSRADSISTFKNPTHTYDEKGYYMVRLRVLNTVTGCRSNDYKLLNVGEAQILKASFGWEAFGNDKKVKGYPVDLVSGSSGDGATVEWDFGDKVQKKDIFNVMDSTSFVVRHYYQLPGGYRACLRITDPVSGQSDEYCQFVYTRFGVDVAEINESGLNLAVYPNPFIDYTTINYVLPKSEYVEIAIFDQLGRRIETLVKSKKDSGEYQITWETKSAATGVYHLKLITEDETLTKQLVITR